MSDGHVSIAVPAALTHGQLRLVRAFIDALLSPAPIDGLSPQQVRIVSMIRAAAGQPVELGRIAAALNTTKQSVAVQIKRIRKHPEIGPRIVAPGRHGLCWVEPRQEAAPA